MAERVKIIGKPYSKGEGGRPSGTKNKITRILKEAALIAAERYGEDGKGKDGLIGLFFDSYRTERKAMIAFLGKILPQQINMRGELDQPIKHYKTAAEIREELERRGICIPEYLKTATDKDPLSRNPFRRHLREPLTIEHRRREIDDE